MAFFCLSFLGKMALCWSSVVATSLPTSGRPPQLPLPVDPPPAHSGAEGRTWSQPELTVGSGFLLELECLRMAGQALKKNIFSRDFWCGPFLFKVSIESYNAASVLCFGFFGHEACGILASCVCACSVAKSCLALWDPMDGSPPGSSCPWDFPGKNTGVGCHVLLQEIYLPDSGVKPTSPALAGEFFTTEPPGKPKLNQTSTLPSDVSASRLQGTNVCCSRQDRQTRQTDGQIDPPPQSMVFLL